MERFTNKFNEVTAGFNTAQKVTMAAIFLFVIAGLYMFSSWANTTQMAPLYVDLDTADAAAVTDQLTSLGVDYELADQGRTVMVPRDRVYQLRLDLGAAGLPSGGADGWALLDAQGITATQAQQQTAYQRALQGELARTITAMEAVDAATVHLVMPKQDLFSGDDIHATASVLVQTAATLNPEQVQTIVNLVSGAVEGLRQDAVTVSDQNGLVLAAPGQSPFDRAGATGSNNQTRDFEEELADEITSMLTAVVGPGKAMVTVSAEMNWDASSVVQETHTPSAVPQGTAPLVSSETTRTEAYTTNATDGDGGQLGATPDGNQSTSNSTYSSDDQTRDYVFDSVIETTERSGGTITRLNVAVLLDDAAVTAAQLTEIESLVTGAAGIDSTRGDTLAVSRLAFDTTVADTLAAELAAAPATGTPSGGGMISTIILGALGFFIVLVAFIQLWRGGRKKNVEELDLVTLTNSLTAGTARPTLARPTGSLEGAGSARPSVRAAAGRSSVAAEDEEVEAEPVDLAPNEELHGLVEQQPEEVARLLRTWLADRRAVSR